MAGGNDSTHQELRQEWGSGMGVGKPQPIAILSIGRAAANPEPRQCWALSGGGMGDTYRQRSSGGFFEAFANLYTDIAEAIVAQ